MDRRMKKRVMYMHTLDGKPATFCDWYGEQSDWSIAFAGRRVKVSDFVPSLRQIRREQRIAMANARRDGGNQAEWSNERRYGYVLVEVPHA